jgi:hypothetical protein
MSRRTAETRAFVHSLASSQLHGLAYKLSRDARSRDWSDAQEWLWQLCVQELEQRRRRSGVLEPTCSCELCLSPFESEPIEPYLG